MFMKKAIGKMRGKPAPTKPDMDEGMDPAFEIPDEDDKHGDMDEAGGKEPTLEGGSEDADEHGRVEDMAAEGDMSPEKHGEGHEGPEADKLAECSDEDLLKELKRRGHPAGKMHAGKPAKGMGDHAEAHEDEGEAEEYSE